MENHVGVADMVLLDPLTEDALVNNLKARFAAERIYVSKGQFWYLLNFVQKSDIISQCGIYELRAEPTSTISCKERYTGESAQQNMRDVAFSHPIIMN